MPGPEFTLKTTPPRLPRGALERGRLMDAWTQVRDRTAIAVVAPGGYGKTTLLLQWRRRWLEEGAVVAWVGADAEDDPVRFTIALLRGLRAASGRPAFDALAAQCAAGAGGETHALTALLAEVALSGTETVLVIDDGERIPDATRDAVVRYLLANAPSNLRVVAGSRTGVLPGTVELAAKGSFAAITVDDLRLRLEESVAILEQRFGARLDIDQRAQVHELAGGWPIGLQLAIAKMEPEDEPADAIPSFSAREGHLRDYLAESLLARLPEEEAALLVRIAPLEHMSAALCEAATGRADAGALLERLARDTPVVMVGEDRDWFRFHPLARDFLLERFERLPAGEQAALHIRASRWFAQHERFHEAARHALAAGDEALAHDHATRALWILGTEGKLAEAREWLERIPPALIAADTGLRMVAAWVRALGERNAEALETALEVAAGRHSTPQMRMVALRVAGGAALYADRIGLTPGILAQWPHDAPTHDPLYVAAPLNCRAIMALHAGATGETRRLAGEIIALGETGTLRLAASLARGMTALSHLWDGDARRAESVLRQPLALAESQERRRGTIAALYAAVLAEALQAQGKLQAAEALLANRIDVIESGFPDVVLAGYRALVGIALGLGDQRRALAALDGLDMLAGKRQSPRLEMHAVAERIRIHAMHGREAMVQRLLRRLDRLEPEFERPEFVLFRPQYRLQAALARAYVALMRQDHDALPGHLDAAELVASALRRNRDLWTILVLRAVADQHRDADRAVRRLESAMELARFGGCTRLLEETHPAAVALMAARRGSPAPAAPETATGAADTSLSRQGLLTAKEAEVLHLLGKGLPNKLIARTLDVSSETVKWHLKNVFLKLSAGSRRQAVDRARMLGLVDS
jgi:LuxR family maltose regulon positive regulatory protein